MSCPLCGGKHCTCSQAGATSILIDPEERDFSEEQFAASLDAVEFTGTSAGTSLSARLRPPGAAAATRDRREQWERIGSTGERQGAAVQANAREESQGVEQGAFWKQEVTSRLESYRARRRRPMRERSLPLDFERAVNREMTQGALSSSVAEAEPLVEPEPLPALPPDPPMYEICPPLPSVAEQVADEVREYAAVTECDESETNVIPFPSPSLPVMPPSFEELAEPILDRPRILEVPEEVTAEAPLSDISVAPEAEQQPASDFELPLLVASMSRRAAASLLDALVVMAGVAVFAAIAGKLGVPVPSDKAGAVLALAAPFLFWAIYEYLFLVYSGTTPGMQVLSLQLVSFDGERPRGASRRGRALALVLSTLSLGLGIAWALLDEDTLCWHDRITRTYLVAVS